jgi:hypothetical protein
MASQSRVLRGQTLLVIYSYRPIKFYSVGGWSYNSCKQNNYNIKSQCAHSNVVSLGGVRLSPVGTSATAGLFYQPRMIDGDDYGAVGGMRIGKGNRSTRRKPAPVPLCLPQIPHDLTWARTRAAAVGFQRLTA